MNAEREGMVRTSNDIIAGNGRGVFRFELIFLFVFLFQILLDNSPLFYDSWNKRVYYQLTLFWIENSNDVIVNWIKNIISVNFFVVVDMLTDYRIGTLNFNLRGDPQSPMVILVIISKWGHAVVFYLLIWRVGKQLKYLFEDFFLLCHVKNKFYCVYKCLKICFKIQPWWLSSLMRPFFIQ